MDPDLARKATAEAVGTGLLVAIVVGSGIAAERLTDDVGLQLLENTVATGAGLAALILTFGAVSGAHFNPVVTMADRLLGTRSNRELVAYVPAQILGGCLGAVLANVMFELPAVELSTRPRASGALWLAEVVATFGLVSVILGVVRSGRTSAVAYAVGGYITAAYWFTSSTSFANPAVTIGRTLSDTFAGIEPASAPAFIAAQVVGGGLAVALARFLYPNLPAEPPAPTDELLVAHHHPTPADQPPETHHARPR